jgi:2-keto-3-deoxy-L-rhamnonate aldolase RhmA
MERYGALNMIQSPNLRQAIRDTHASNKALLGSVLGIGSVANAKILAATSSDWVWIDAEHTPYSPTLLCEVV